MPEQGMLKNFSAQTSRDAFRERGDCRLLSAWASATPPTWRNRQARHRALGYEAPVTHQAAPLLEASASAAPAAWAIVASRRVRSSGSSQAASSMPQSTFSAARSIGSGRDVPLIQYPTAGCEIFRECATLLCVRLASAAIHARNCLCPWVRFLGFKLTRG